MKGGIQREARELASPTVNIERNLTDMNEHFKEELNVIKKFNTLFAQVENINKDILE
jgi:flagellar hook-associated protein FlgK